MGWGLYLQCWLSILFVRFNDLDREDIEKLLNFQFSLWDSTQLRWTTLSFSLDFQFSLWDSFRLSRSAHLRLLCTFNSLCEIQGEMMNEVLLIGNFQFSLWDSKKLKVILKMESDLTFQFSLWDSGFQPAGFKLGFQAFNSLCEIRESGEPHDADRPYRKNFQFSLWDSWHWCSFDGYLCRAFNSLCEIPVLFLLPPLWGMEPFNSLCEIRCFSVFLCFFCFSFNSLCEIQQYSLPGKDIG